MLSRLRNRDEWQFFRILPLADRLLATAWWLLLIARGLLPALFALALGVLVSAVTQGSQLAPALILVGMTFLLLQVLAPLHQTVSANLGDRTAAWLYDSLTKACLAPPGMAHLENPALTHDLTMARDFDLGITGPPLHISLDFIAAGLVELVGGLACALILAFYAWWAPLLLGGAWLATHYLLRESGVWKDRNTEQVRDAQRHAEYSYRLAVDPPAAKELRLFGLSQWLLARFRQQRQLLFELRWQATRLRQRPVLWSLLLVTLANLCIFLSLALAASSGQLPLPQLAVYAMAAVGTSMIAFGGLSWALDSAAAPVGATLRLGPTMQQEGNLQTGTLPAAQMPATCIECRHLGFIYPGTNTPVLQDFNLQIPAGSSLAIVGQNGAGKTTLAKLLCRLYDPQAGSILVDGIDLRQLDIRSWRERVTVVFQDFIRYERSLRDNVAPGALPGASTDAQIRQALQLAGAEQLADLDQILAKGYAGGTDLSGGQWQRVALARALFAVSQGAGLVLLDEPTAQLDVRAEADIFRRLLTATRHTTCILISHRFSTVRLADQICVLEQGRVIELGNHETLMALGGRYQQMFQLQAARFNAEAEAGAP